MSALFFVCSLFNTVEIVKQYHKVFLHSFLFRGTFLLSLLILWLHLFLEEISTTLDVEVDKVLQVLDTKELTLESSKIHTD